MLYEIIGLLKAKTKYRSKNEEMRTSNTIVNMTFDATHYTDEII